MVSSGKPSVSLGDILKLTSEIKVLHYYTGISKVPCLICSPLRKDKHPSFSLSSPDGSKIYYKDFCTGESGSLYGLLASLWGVSYEEALQKIYRDVKKMNEGGSVARLDNGHRLCISSTKDFKLDVRVREWRDYDFEFWSSFGISKEWLDFADVHPIINIFITRDKETSVFGAEKYAYVYVERKDNKVSLKTYQPFSKTIKWLSSMDRSVWSLWTKLPEKGRNLFITSSLKDCLNLWSNLGIPAISMQGEGYLPKVKIMEELKARFENIVVFYDNDYTNPDNPGRKDSLALAEAYGLKRVDIPAEYQAKDPSDLYKKHGKERYLEIMKEILSDKLI